MNDLEQREIFKRNISNLLNLSGKTQKELAEAINVSTSTVNSWFVGAKLPRMNRIQQLADYFDVPKSVLLERQDDNTKSYYINKDACEYAQFLHENPDYRVLFDASKNLEKQDLIFIVDMINRLKKK